MNRYSSPSREKTAALGKAFAATLVPGDVVALFGELGAGKTQFVSGVCQGLRVEGHVASPTFTLINEYPAPFGTVAHVDLYRIERTPELAELGIQEYFRTDCICLIEWAERALGILPPGHYRVKLLFGGDEGSREILVGGGDEVFP